MPKHIFQMQNSYHSAGTDSGSNKRENRTNNKQNRYQACELKRYFDRDKFYISHEDYIKAMFCFTVNPTTKSFAICGMDNLNWADVESVIVSSTDGLASRCPICLDFSMVKRCTP